MQVRIQERKTRKSPEGTRTKETAVGYMCQVMVLFGPGIVYLPQLNLKKKYFD
jgi:hypothetical protein